MIETIRVKSGFFRFDRVVALVVFGYGMIAAVITDIFFETLLFTASAMVGTAGGTDILVNRTETAVGSGDQNLIDLQVGGTSKFKVDNAGNAVMSGVVTQMTSSAALPSTTEFPNDQDWGIHHDTANDPIYLAFNKSGSIKKTLIN